MLTNDQITDLWERRISAEVRSLYFGDLANLLSTRKQWITGISFFFSSGAAATLIGKGPNWIPIALSVIVAIITAYAVATNLDLKMKTMAKLQYSWAQLSHDYDHLWNHTYSDDSEEKLLDLASRELEISQLAATDAPNDQARLGRWQERVFQLHHLAGA
jgi:hypothetical protein